MAAPALGALLLLGAAAVGGREVRGGGRSRRGRCGGRRSAGPFRRSVLPSLLCGGRCAAARSLSRPFVPPDPANRGLGGGWARPAVGLPILPSISTSIRPRLGLFPPRSVPPSVLPSLPSSIPASVCPVHPCLCSWLGPSLRPSVHPSLSPSVPVSIHPSVGPSLPAPIPTLVHPCLSSSLLQSIPASIHPSLGPSVPTPVCLSLPGSVHPSVCPYICPSLPLSIPALVHLSLPRSVPASVHSCPSVPAPVRPSPQVSMQYNPGWNGSSVNVLHVRAVGRSDALHYVWSTIGAPSVLLVATRSPDSALSIDWGRLLSPAPTGAVWIDPPGSVVYAAAVVFTKLFEYGNANASEEVFYPTYDLSDFSWDSINRTMNPRR
eukprot:XP_024999216.1 BCL-6 corepressor-like protein 1 [Gallus gallus]